jgi:hypothetical protein
MFHTPKIPNAPPPAPTAPSLPAILSNRSRTMFGQGKGSLAGTFITGPTGNPMGNVPGSTGQSGMKTALGT